MPSGGWPLLPARVPRQNEHVTERPWRASGFAPGLGGVLMLALGVVAAALSGLGWAELVDGFVVSSLGLGVLLGLAAYPLVRVEPGNRVGWSLMVASLAYLASGCGYATLAWRTTPGETAVAWRVVADVTSLGWVVAVFGAIPLAFLLFPAGRLPERARHLLRALVIATVLWGIAAMVLAPQDATTGLGIEGYLRWTLPGEQTVIPVLATVFALAEYVAIPIVLGMLFRRGGETEKRQVLWVFVAVVIVVLEFAIEQLLQSESIFGVLVLGLPPLGALVAIVRYRLVDITKVASRLTLFLVMSAAVLLSYVALVAFSERALSARVPYAPPVLAALLVALAFDPVRRWLQIRVDRVFYGGSGDVHRAVSSVSGMLAGADQRGIESIEAALGALVVQARVPWAAVVRDDEEISSHGLQDGAFEAIDLPGAADHKVTLRVGRRRGETKFRKPDKVLFGVLAPMLGVAVAATETATSLARARRELVFAQDAERRRLRRELHDAVGPLLAAAALQVDAARRVSLGTDAASEPLAATASAIAGASMEIRVLLEELRPTALDSIGLIPAVVELSRGFAPLEILVTSDDSGEPLPSAVEVAVYRIVVEALTNVARHSGARTASVSVTQLSGEIHVQIADDGEVSRGPWLAGVGLGSMRERAAELGGRLVAGPGAGGGLVKFWLPTRSEG